MVDTHRYFYVPLFPGDGCLAGTDGEGQSGDPTDKVARHPAKKPQVLCVESWMATASAVDPYIVVQLRLPYFTGLLTCAGCLLRRVVLSCAALVEQRVSAR